MYLFPLVYPLPFVFVSTETHLKKKAKHYFSPPAIKPGTTSFFLTAHMPLSCALKIIKNPVRQIPSCVSSHKSLCFYLLYHPFSRPKADTKLSRCIDSHRTGKPMQGNPSTNESLYFTLHYIYTLKRVDTPWNIFSFKECVLLFMLLMFCFFLDKKRMK